MFYAKTTNQAAFLERAITAEGILAQRIYDSQAHDQHVSRELGVSYAEAGSLGAVTPPGTKRFTKGA